MSATEIAEPALTLKLLNQRHHFVPEPHKHHAGSRSKRGDGGFRCVTRMGVVAESRAACLVCLRVPRVSSPFGNIVRIEG